MDSGGPLELYVLGGVHAARGGAPLSGFESDKVRALLVYLALERDRPHRREALANLLWPEHPADTALHRLRQALGNLRVVLGDAVGAGGARGTASAGTATPVLIADRTAVRLNPAAPLRVDALAFAGLVDAWRQHRRHAGRACPGCAQRLAEATALYRGPFLEGLTLRDSERFAEWASDQGERLHRQMLDALLALADYWERRGEHARTREYAAHAVRLDPWREEAHTQLMRALAWAGERTAAVRQYEQCRRALAADLGVEPSDGTRRLLQQITAGEVGPGTRPALPPHNLPAPPTAFVGRQDDVQAAHDLLATARLVTLTGPGGVGKTRLAVRVAADALPDHADGVWFVDLAPVADASLVVPAIARVIGCWPLGDRPALDVLRSYLAPRSLLLVLDNFEHVIAAGPRLVDLLSACPKLSLLVTSREVLRVSGEHVLRVPPLALPDPDDEPPFERLRQYDAMQLYAARAQAAEPAFELDEENAGVVAAICHRLDGLPLAIELAAAHARFLGPYALLARLARALPFLETGARDAAPRQRTLRNTIAWSYDLLTPDERRLFRVLGVLGGSWTLAAAETVAGEARLLACLASLVDKSLVRPAPREDDEPRFALLETVREFAYERLVAAGEADAAHDRQLRRCVGLAEAAAAAADGPDDRAWLDRLSAEHEHLMAALEWSLGEPAGRPPAAGTAPALGVRLAGELWRFWYLRGSRHEGLRWLARALKCAATAPSASRAKVRLGIGMLTSQEDAPRAQALLEACLDEYRLVGDRRGYAEALLHLAGQARVVARATGGDYARARCLIEESLAIARALGDRPLIASTLIGMAIREWVYDDDERQQMAREALSLALDLGDSLRVAMANRILGDVALRRGDLAAARSHFAEDLARTRALKERGGTALALHNLGDVALREGDPAQAERYFAESLALFEEIGAGWRIPALQRKLGEAALAQRDQARARARFEESLATARALGEAEQGALAAERVAALADAQLADVARE